MENIHRCLQGFTFVFLLSIFQLANAGSFADAFKVFVLGSDANVNTTDNLLSNSSQSQQCMQCHDGSAAKAIILKDANAPLQISGHQSINHPVGLSYRDYANMRPASYVSLENLDARIQLENGNITCVSCHKTKTGEQQVNASVDLPVQVCGATGELTTGSGSTGLCMACHVM